MIRMKIHKVRKLLMEFGQNETVNEVLNIKFDMKLRIIRSHILETILRMHVRIYVCSCIFRHRYT